MNIRRYIPVILLALTTGVLAACGDEEEILPQNTEQKEEQIKSNDDNSGNDNSVSNDTAGTNRKTLVVYFSRAGYNYVSSGGSTGRITEWLEKGHTAVVAGFITELTGADSFEILPTVPYPDDYMACVDRSHQEQAADARPVIKDSLQNVAQYDTVFVGAPVWSGRMPMILHTFYESYDLSGKVLIPFTTHAGSGMANASNLMKQYFPSATMLDGFTVPGTSADNSKSSVEAWLKRINVIK